MFKKFVAAIIVITLILMGGVFIFAKDYDITLSEIEAQTAIDEYLAANRPESFGVNFTPKNISIDFQANNTAQVKSDMLIDGHGYKGQFDGAFATGMDYRVPRLYLDDLQLIEGGFQADESTQSDLNDLKKSVINIVERKRESDAEINSKIGLERPSDDFVEDMILKSTKYVFESIPIFDLRASGKTGMAASLALKDVKFTEDAAIITFSPVMALLRILMAIGMICLTITWFAGPSIIGFFIERAVKCKN